MAGFGALLANEPPFGPPRANTSELGAKVLETAVAVVHQLVEYKPAASGAGASSSSPVVASSRRSGVRSSGSGGGGGGGAAGRLALALDDTSASAWCTLLAGVLASPRRAKTSPVRRVARRLLLVVAGSRDNYHAARDAAAFATETARLAAAAVPRSGLADTARHVIDTHV